MSRISGLRLGKIRIETHPSPDGISDHKKYAITDILRCLVGACYGLGDYRPRMQESNEMDATEVPDSRTPMLNQPAFQFTVQHWNPMLIRGLNIPKATEFQNGLPLFFVLAYGVTPRRPLNVVRLTNVVYGYCILISYSGPLIIGMNY